ncbi:glycine cleavage system protein GcvH [Jiangella rhizosphaerae]|uniref:Glycine cleavage system H protein n=1 Tax=Jiangella rhizosphaerae TaxID=2293569 RepID=A0A418KKH3_9ACTN|nr:glycine cleavage system protein GcvH [Jiangella rhizosphaerae]RIQ16197.1 glycine cleavage system protein GcvH [Jiangella rhizosphaerae]
MTALHSAPRRQISLYPDDLRYTAEHEWVRSPGEAESSVRVGITHYAQEQLGDIVYVQLPAVGDEVTAGGVCGELESTKSVSELFAPVTGTVVARNEELDAAPEQVNADPYGAGWMIEIVPSDPGAVDQLLTADDYRSQVEG